MTHPETNFRALLERFRSGDADAAQQLFDQYSPHILRAVRRKLHDRLRNQYDSMDFTQDVWASFVTIPREIRFDSPGDLIAFLSRVAYHKVIDVHRGQFATQKRDRDMEFQATTDPDRLAGRVPTASQVVMAEEHWEVLRRRLPERYLPVIDMLREGHSHGQIAARMGLCEKTIQRLLHKVSGILGVL
jgi:RNA polymerase sigma factor (sigma-70 family)